MTPNLSSLSPSPFMLGGGAQVVDLLDTGPRAVERLPLGRQGGPVDMVFARSMVQHRRLGSQMEAMRSAIADTALLMGEALNRNGRLIFFGNSGAGVIAGLLAASMQVRLGALARTPPRSAGLVAFALEEGHALPGEEASRFASALARRARPGDCAVALSTSGDTANILAALRAARDAGLTMVGLLGNNGGKAHDEVDVAITVPERDPMRVYEAQLFAGHTLCRQLEWALRPPA